MSIFERDTKQVEQLETEIREFVQRDVANVRTETANANALATDNVSLLLQCTLATPVKEIDEIVGRLELLRDRLREGGERVQRRIKKYTAVCRETVQSIKLIAESLNPSISVPTTPSVPEGAHLPDWLKSRNLETGAGQTGSRALSPSSKDTGSIDAARPSHTTTGPPTALSHHR